MKFHLDIIVVLKACTRKEYESSFVNMIWEEACKMLKTLCVFAQYDLSAYIGDFCLYLTAESKVSLWTAAVRIFDYIYVYLLFIIAYRLLTQSSQKMLLFYTRESFAICMFKCSIAYCLRCRKGNVSLHLCHC